MGQPTKQAQAIRAALETISLEAAVIEIRLPAMRLRVAQERTRTGHNDLLEPVLRDADDVAKSVRMIRMQINAALAAIGCARLDG